MARSRASDLLDEIQRGALDPNSDLSSVLRKCIALGGESGSHALRDWAVRELKGYEGADEVPGYRTVPAPIMVSGRTATHTFDGQQIPVSTLPSPAPEHIKEEVELRLPVAQLTEMVASAKRAGKEYTRLGLPGGAALATLMTQESRQRNQYASQYISAVYWEVSITAIHAVVDTVRTTLVELVAELRVGLPANADAPSREQVDNAVNVTVYGKGNRVQIAAVSDAGEGDGFNWKIQEPEESGAHRVAWWIFGIAGVVVAVCAVLAFVLS